MLNISYCDIHATESNSTFVLFVNVRRCSEGLLPGVAGAAADERSVPDAARRPERPDCRRPERQRRHHAWNHRVSASYQPGQSTTSQV